MYQRSFRQHLRDKKKKENKKKMISGKNQQNDELILKNIRNILMGNFVRESGFWGAIKIAASATTTRNYKQTLIGWILKCT